MLLVGTGSEVHFALAAREKLGAQGVRARVVSMPSVELFQEQSADYRQEVLPSSVPKVVIEAGVPTGWRDTVGDNSDVVGLRRFGASGPAKVVLEKLGFTPDAVAERARTLVGR